MKRIIIIVTILLFTLNLSSCKQNVNKPLKMNVLKKNKKYKLFASSCAPIFYPAEIVSGNFYLEDEYALYIPKGNVTKKGWGRTSGLHAVGPDLKSLPVSFDIKWVSFVERKSYAGKFDLDKDLVAYYFNKGFINTTGKHKTYNTIFVGMAPGGMLVVWLSGGERAVEIGRYQATETTVTKDEFLPESSLTVEEYIEEIIKEDILAVQQNNAFMNNIPFTRWDTYRKKYTWRPKIVFDDQGKHTRAFIKNYNGEKIDAEAGNPDLFEYKEHAIPKYCSIQWVDKRNNKYGAKIYLGNLYGSTDEIYKEMEDEIFKAFNTIFKDAETKAELVFTIDKYNSNLVLSLESETEKLIINKAKIKIYPRT